MSKRLGYETTHVMLNLERKLNKQMNADPEINKSALVNKLLRKYFEGKLCPRCFGDVIRMIKCEKCAVEWIACRNEGCKVHGWVTETRIKNEPRHCNSSLPTLR